MAAMEDSGVQSMCWTMQVYAKLGYKRLKSSPPVVSVLDNAGICLGTSASKAHLAVWVPKGAPL